MPEGALVIVPEPLLVTVSRYAGGGKGDIGLGDLTANGLNT